MIDLATPPVSIDEVTLFAATTPGVWYVLPTRPRLLRNADGKPDISLTKFRRDALGEPGGTLHLSVDLSAAPSALDRAAAKLRGPGGAPASFAPLPVRNVRCDLMVWSGAEPDFAAVSATATKEAPFSATFDARLVKEGAVLFDSAFKLGQSPGVLIYWLSCPARRPPLDGRLRIDGERVQRLVAEQFGSGPLQYQQIAGLASALQQQGLVKLEVMAMTDSMVDVHRANEALERVLLSEVFEATSPAGPVTTDADSPERLASQTRRFKPKSPAPGTITIDLAQAADIGVTLGCAATISQLIEPFATDAASGAFVLEVEPAPTQEKRI